MSDAARPQPPLPLRCVLITGAAAGCDRIRRGCVRCAGHHHRALTRGNWISPTRRRSRRCWRRRHGGHQRRRLRTHVDAAERHANACYRANARSAVLAAACARHDARLLSRSLRSGLRRQARRGVEAPCPCRSDATAPLNVLGEQGRGERRVLNIAPRSLLVHAGAVFESAARTTSWRRRCALQPGDETLTADDEVVSPTYLLDLAQAALDLA